MTKPMTLRFGIWQDATTGDFEVVAWRDRRPLVVQTNIRTRVKAQSALAFWRELVDRDIVTAVEKAVGDKNER